MRVGVEPGIMRDYKAIKSFALNFEDRKIKSPKILVGETLSFDGDVVSYVGKDGVLTGRAPSLKGVIQLGWVIPKNGEEIDTAPSKTTNTTDYVPSLGGSFETHLKQGGLNAPSAVGAGKPSSDIPNKNDDYDPNLGGSFDTHLSKGGINPVTLQKETPKHGVVIQHEDRIVKKTAHTNKHVLPVKPETGKHEILRQDMPTRDTDREPLTVGSSTTIPRIQGHSSKIIQSNNAGAQMEIPMKNLPQRTAGDRPAKRTFLVDASTPNVPEDPMTAPNADEIRKMRAPRVIHTEDSQQNSQVVGRIKGIESEEKTSAEGITLRKTVPRESTGKAHVGSGSGASDLGITAKVTPGEPVSDLTGETTVIKKIGEPAPQAEMETSVVVKGPDTDKAATKRAQRMASIAKEPVKAAVVKPPVSEEPCNYLLMLPKSWKDMHWVQKEKFVQGLTDKGFIEYISTVETTKAILNACAERLKKLEEAVA